MPPKPNYRLRCAAYCQDAQGRFRDGETWIYLHGRTLWVCHPCAERLGRAAGLPTSTMQRAAVRAREARQQQLLFRDGGDTCVTS